MSRWVICCPSDAAIRGLTICIFVTAAVACATAGRDLVRDDAVRIERVPSAHVIFTKVRVTQRDTTVLVDGFLRSRAGTLGGAPGHVHVDLIVPDGRVVERHFVDYLGETPMSRYAEFFLRLETVPPKGSTIRLTNDDRRQSNQPNP